MTGGDEALTYSLGEGLHDWPAAVNSQDKGASPIWD